MSDQRRPLILRRDRGGGAEITAIGIDFGTTNSRMARVRDGRGDVIRDAEGEEKTPSVVFYGAEETLVGVPAVDVLANANGDATTPVSSAASSAIS
jgi:molecular chaperone DnaK (HSP70)